MIENGEKIPCTVTVLTFNSEKGLRRCLESAKDFKEIIICDGGSTDRTREIACEFGCVIIDQNPSFKTSENKIADFAGVRNQTLRAATNKWFLILDSDEYLSRECVEEIASIIANDTPESPKLFHVLRKYEVNGVIIDNAGTYPSYQPRFFHVDHVVHFARKLHEKIVPKPGEKYGYFTKPTIVPVDIDIPAMRRKHNYYLQIEKERSAGLSKAHLFRAIIISLRSVIARWVKIARNVFRPGKKMPLSFELASTEYSLKMSSMLVILLVRKLFLL